MGIGCIADVIRDADNRAVAAISISTLTVRMDENFLIRTIPLFIKLHRRFLLGGDMFHRKTTHNSFY